MPTTDHFFSRLTDVTRFTSVVESAPYTDVPPDWCVAITDGVLSTSLPKPKKHLARGRRGGW